MALLDLLPKVLRPRGEVEAELGVQMLEAAPRPSRFMTKGRRAAFNASMLEKAVKVAQRPDSLQHIPERERGAVQSWAQAMQKAAGPSLPPLGKRNAPAILSQTRGGGPPNAPRPVSVADLARNAAAALRPNAMVTPAEIEVELRRQGIEWTEPFAPGRPLTPYYGYSRRPREYDYRVGRNITTDTRPDRLPFQVIKQVVEGYDLASICIRHIINDLRSMKLEFSPMADYQGDVGKEISAARAFLRKPDGHRHFTDWLAMYMHDVLRFDAGCLYKERNAAGKLVRLPVVSGVTLAPIVDYYGGRPQPPAPAFQQFIQGIPWDWLSADDVVYEPQWPIAESPYGVAAIETCLLNANTDVRLQMFFLGFFTDGVVPEMLIEAPEGMTDPDALAEIQETWDAWYQNNQTGRHGARWIPAGSKPFPYKPQKLDEVFAEYVMRRTVAAFGLVPQDLGFTETVNRATADTQVDTQFRVTTLPNTEYYEAILDSILQEDLQLPIAVHFDTGREKEDRLMEAQAQQLYVSMGAKSPDEVRTGILGLPVDNANPIPRFFDSARLGPIPVKFLQSVSGPIDPNTLSPSEPPPAQEYVPLEGMRENIPDPNAPVNNPAPRKGWVNPKVGPQNVHELGDMHTGRDRFNAAPGKPTPPSPAPARRPAVGKAGSGGPGGGAIKAVSAGVTSATGLAGIDLEGGNLRDTERDEDYTGEEYDGEEIKKELLRWRSNARTRLIKGQAPRRFESFIIPQQASEAVWRALENAASREHIDAVFAAALDAVGMAKAHRDMRHAGCCLRAEDTRRVLVIQRAYDEKDGARGTWEFPGGHLHPGEDPKDGAQREWEEEVGVHFPKKAKFASKWEVPGHLYTGHVFNLPKESDIKLDGREEVKNPDGNSFEAVAWMNPHHLADHPGLRPELKASVNKVMAAIEEARGK